MMNGPVHTNTKHLIPTLMALLLLLGSAGAARTFAQTVDVWQPLLHAEALLDTLPGTAQHFSSWARNGSNGDLGNYYGTMPDGGKILADAVGPGMVTGFWATRSSITDTTMRLRIFVDDTVHACIDTPLVHLIGRTAPFVAPLADTASCALYSYVPIPFQSRLRIVYNGLSLYYHVDIQQYPAGTTVPPFTWPPGANYLARVDSLCGRFLEPERPAWADQPYTSATGSATLAPGGTQTLIDYDGARAVRRWLLRLNAPTQSVLENLRVRIYTDERILPDLEGPVSALFGAMQGWHAYRSFLTGAMGDSLYLNLPTRFEQRLRIEMENRSAVSVTITAIAELVDLPPEASGPLRLRAVCRDQNPTITGQRYLIAALAGRGQFVGVTFDMQIPDMHVLEGDEAIYRDGQAEPFWRGTGTEDYFKGAYYWCGGQGVVALANHGCIRYRGRTGVATYRAHVLDPVTFQSQFRMDIEVGPYDNLTAHDRSAAFFYLLPERWQVDDAGQDGHSFPGESLHIARYGLMPGTALTEARLGTALLQTTPAQPVADGNGTLEFTAVTPALETTGLLPLTAVLPTGSEAIAPAWSYSAVPLLCFLSQRTDIDSCVFALDTLAVELRGLTAGATATIAAGEIPLPWLGAVPVADALGTLRGSVQVPAPVIAGDYTVRATSPGYPDAACTQRLKVRGFYRVEAELQPATATLGTYATRYAPDNAAVGVVDPWGRNLVYQLTGQGVGSALQITFGVPMTGIYQTTYFFGRAAGGATFRILIDDTVDVASYDSYTAAAGSWRWLRSDSVRGTPRTLAAGPHTLRFEITGRNAAATGWLGIFDQIVLTLQAEPSPRTPAPVRGLRIQSVSDSVQLCWPAVRTDISGQPLDGVQYVVYRTVGTAAPVMRAVVADTTYRDVTNDAPDGSVISYDVQAQASPPP